MKRYVSLAAIVLLLAGTAPRADAEVNRDIRCGGFPISYGLSFSTGPIHHQQASTVTAIAAVTDAGGSSRHPRAWVIWDQRGRAFLGLKKDSPAQLRKLWTDAEPLDFQGPGQQIRFTPLKTLPKQYALLDCPDALP